MKYKIMAAIIAATLSSAALAGNSNDINQRLLELEQRLISMEQRATSAEQHAAKADAKIKQLEKQQSTPVTAQTIPVQSLTPPPPKEQQSAPQLSLSGFGDLKIYGDVEFNMDGTSGSGSLTTIQTSANDDWSPGKNERWDVNGRILLGFDGIRQLSDGHFAGFSAQPLADLSGSTNVDDATLFFGRQNDWKVKAGRFEAYSMFPLNQDTFIEHSGNTSNEIYGDGYGYLYAMKEARGRSSNGGNFQLTKNIGDWYFELNTQAKDGTKMFIDQQYHGNKLESKKNVVYLRPIVAWNQGRFTASAGMESNVVNNAYGYYDRKGRWVDQSDRTGYAMTFNWNGLATDPVDGVVINASTAYMDAPAETDFSAGANILWRRFEVGYIYAHNKIEEFNKAGIDDTCEDDCWISDPGSYDLHTIHLSYQIPNIMDMENFNIYLGAYTSWINADAKDGDSHNDSRFGGRVRFKYFF